MQQSLPGLDPHPGEYNGFTDDRRRGNNFSIGEGGVGQNRTG